MSIVNVEPEKAIIGIILADGANQSAAALSLLDEEDFQDPLCFAAYCAIKQCITSDITPDIVAVSDAIVESGLHLPFGWRTELMAICSDAILLSQDIQSYAKIIRAKRVKQELHLVGEQLIYSAENTSAFELDAVVTKTQNHLSNISSRLFSANDAKSASDIGEELIQNTIEKRNNPKDYVGIQTGFPDLDRLTLGWKKNELIIVAARPAMGKSAFMLAAVKSAVLDHNKPCLIFSLEMGREQLMQRLVANVSSLNSTKISKGELTEQELMTVIESTRRIGRAPLFIQDNIRMTPAGLRSVTQRLNDKMGSIGLICVDYLQILQSGLKANGTNRVEEVSFLSRELKAIAREFNVPIIALSQLSRAVEARNDKRPMLSDLRESGSIEQDADVVAFLYRDDYYNEFSDKAGIAEIHIAKNREGPTGKCELLWRPEFSQFINRPAVQRVHVNPYGDTP